MGSATRIKGTGLGFKLAPTPDAPSGDYWADCIRVELRPRTLSIEGDLDRMGAPEEHWAGSYLEVEAIQSTDPNSLWSFLTEHYGQEVPFSYSPHGNPTPTPDQPHWTGIVSLPPPPPIGGQAGQDVTYTFTTTLQVVQGPIRVHG